MAKKVYRAVKASTGTPEDLFRAVQDKIAELGGGIEMSTDISAGADCECCGDIEQYDEIEGSAPFTPYGSKYYNVSEEPAAPQGNYRLVDSYGAPQNGAEVIDFDEWYEVEDYLDEHPEVAQRIAEGYAHIDETADLVTM